MCSQLTKAWLRRTDVSCSNSGGCISGGCISGIRRAGRCLRGQWRVGSGEWRDEVCIYMLV